MRIHVWTGAILGLLLTASAANAQDYANVRTFLENSPEFKIANPILQQLARTAGIARFNWAIVEVGSSAFFSSDRGEETEHLGRPVRLQASVIQALKALLARVISDRFNDVGRQSLIQTPWVRDYADMYAVDGPRLYRLRQFLNEFCRDNQARCK
jgi:hypothetical protein